MTGRQLTKAERESWRIRLEHDMAPDVMISVVDELKGVLRGHMHVQAGLAFVRDAWTAGRFAKARGADAVRLWPGYRPDCELIFQDRRELFEIVEADQPGRRRSVEYRELIQTTERGEAVPVEEDPVEDWVARAANVVQMLEHASMSKAAKGYDRTASLLIYLNLHEWDIRQQQIEAALQPCTASAKDAFHEVWVLWKGAAYPLWRGGVAVPVDTWPKREDDDEVISDAALWTSATSEAASW